MDDFHLVPVDHQPDFDDASLVPVEHDPFGADGGAEQGQVQATQTPTQPAPFQPQQPQSSTTGDDLPDVGPPLIGDGGQFSAGTAFGNKAADVASKVAYGMMRQFVTLPQRAIEAAKISAAHNYGPSPDVISDSDAPFVDPLPAVALETALTMMGASAPVPRPTGMILGANKVARGVARKATDDHHSLPIYLGGPVKQKLVELPRSLHVEFHRRLDAVVPKQRGTAYYKSLSPEKMQEALQELAKVTKEFDAEHGTKLYDALLKNGFSEP